MHSDIVFKKKLDNLIEKTNLLLENSMFRCIDFRLFFEHLNQGDSRNIQFEQIF